MVENFNEGKSKGGRLAALCFLVGVQGEICLEPIDFAGGFWTCSRALLIPWQVSLNVALQDLTVRIDACGSGHGGMIRGKRDEVNKSPASLQTSLRIAESQT